MPNKILVLVIVAPFVVATPPPTLNCAEVFVVPVTAKPPTAVNRLLTPKVLRALAAPVTPKVPPTLALP